jgi:NAD(P)-dependent dehydrogenase (short-subunit alcohol dehydrogenase family)
LPSFDYEGKKVLVTGGSRGLGRAMAGAYAEAGAEVMVASRKQESCDAAAKEIEAATGRRALGVACHVGHWEDCDRLVEAAYEEMGRVDVLVNNAGMSPLYPSLAEVTEDLWDKVLGVNLKGPFRLAALIGTRMVADGAGAIINVSSVASIRPAPRELPYSAAKAGLNALTVGFSQAFGPAVRVNTIMAGPFLTDISKAWDMDDFNRRARSVIPLRRAGQAEEVIGAALYLASDAASFTTGAVITVDGGVAQSVP